MTWLAWRTMSRFGQLSLLNQMIVTAREVAAQHGISFAQALIDPPP